MKNILIVDDDDSTRFILSRVFEGMKCRTAVAADGADVAALIANQRFDLLVLDLYMPGMNGFEVLRQLRRGEAGLPARTPRTVRILVVSGESYPASVANAKTLGADAYLVKPVDVDVLERTVRRLLRLPSELPRNRNVSS